MRQRNLLAAEYIKSQLIDFLLMRYSNDVLIANEFMYGTKRKLVDLFVLTDNKLIGIEVKADNDDLRRMPEQINEYRKIFDYIIICTTNKHLKQIIQLVQKDVGIYLIKDNLVQIIQKPRQQKALDKVEMLYSINARYLRKNLLAKVPPMNADEIRAFYCKKAANDIHSLLLTFLRKKIEVRFRCFLQYKGSQTHIDDIPLLSTPMNVQ